MVGPGVIRAGRAALELFLDKTKLEQGLNSLKDRFRNIGRSLTRLSAGVGAVATSIVAPLAAATKRFAAVGDQIGKMSTRTGVAAEELSTLRFAADQTGTSLEAVELALTGMSRFMLNAERGSKAATDTLRDLGLSLDELQRLRPAEQFRLIASRLALVQDETRRSALAMQVFGKSGRDVIPLVLSDIDALQQKARDLGIELSAADVKAAEDFTDAMSRLRFSIEGVTNRIGAALAPALERMITQWEPNIVAAGQWVRENKELIVTVGKIGGVLTGIAGILGTTAIGFHGIAAGIGAIATLSKGAIAGLVAIKAELAIVLPLLIFANEVARSIRKQSPEPGRLEVPGLRDKSKRSLENFFATGEFEDPQAAAGVLGIEGLDNLIDDLAGQAEADFGQAFADLKRDFNDIFDITPVTRANVVKSLRSLVDGFKGLPDAIIPDFAKGLLDGTKREAEREAENLEAAANGIATATPTTSSSASV